MNKLQKTIENAEISALERYQKLAYEATYFMRGLEELTPIIEIVGEDSITISEYGSIFINIPFDITVYHLIKTYLERLGYKSNTRDNESSDKAQLWTTLYKWLDEDQDIWLYVYITIDAKKPDSHCKLIPIQTEIVERVTLYERVCDEGYKEIVGEN